MKIEDLINVVHIKNHKKVNKKLLQLINKITKNPYHWPNEKFSHSDWTLPKEYHREYVPYFYSVIKPYMDEMCAKFKSVKWEIHNCWFQQYNKNDYHNWHNHMYSHWTNVYFVELPNSNMSTELYEWKSLKLKEGDLLTFPSFWYHKSKLNKSLKRKTIISFNSSFKEFDYKSTGEVQKLV